MINSINQKHVMIVMSNGAVLEGCVCEIDEFYLRLIEQDNNSVIVKIDDISFSRIKVAAVEQTCEQPAPTRYPAKIASPIISDEEAKDIKSYARPNVSRFSRSNSDLTMETPTAADPRGIPSFERQT